MLVCVSWLEGKTGVTQGAEGNEDKVVCRQPHLLLLLTGLCRTLDLTRQLTLSGAARRAGRCRQRSPTRALRDCALPLRTSCLLDLLACVPAGAAPLPLLPGVSQYQQVPRLAPQTPEQ